MSKGTHFRALKGRSKRAAAYAAALTAITAGGIFAIQANNAANAAVMPVATPNSIEVDGHTYAISGTGDNAYIKIGDSVTTIKAPYHSEGFTIDNVKILNATSGADVAYWQSDATVFTKYKIDFAWTYAPESGTISSGDEVVFDLANNSDNICEDSWKSDPVFSKSCGRDLTGIMRATESPAVGSRSNMQSLLDSDGNVIGGWFIASKRMHFVFNDNVAGKSSVSGNLETGNNIRFGTYVPEKLATFVSVGDKLIPVNIKANASLAAAAENGSMSVTTTTANTITHAYYSPAKTETSRYKNYNATGDPTPSVDSIIDNLIFEATFDSGSKLAMSGFTARATWPTKWTSGDASNAGVGRTAVSQFMDCSIENGQWKKWNNNGKTCVANGNTATNGETAAFTNFADLKEFISKTPGSYAKYNDGNIQKVIVNFGDSVEGADEDRYILWGDVVGNGNTVMTASETSLNHAIYPQAAFDLVGAVHPNNTAVSMWSMTLTETVSNEIVESGQTQVDDISTFYWTDPNTNKTISNEVKSKAILNGGQSKVLQKNSILVHSINAHDQQPISGIAVKLERQVNGQWVEVGTVTTGKGVATFNDLIAGDTYRISQLEDSYLDHYVAGSSKICLDDKCTQPLGATFKASEEGQELYVQNTKETVTVTFKADSEGIGLFDPIEREVYYGEYIQNVPAGASLEAKKGWSFKEWSVDTAMPVTSSIEITPIWAQQTTQLMPNIVFIDMDNMDNVRPTAVRYTVYADDVQVRVGELNATNNYRATVKDLPVYNDNEEKIVYRIALNENDYPKYILKTTAGGANFTLEHVPTTAVSVEKVWIDNDNSDGIRPEFEIIKLMADGKSAGVTYDAIENPGVYTFEDLPKYKDIATNPTEIVYTIASSTPAEGYSEAVITGNMQDGFVSTSTHIASNSLSGSSIVINFGEDFSRSENEPGVIITPKDSNNPVLSGANGEKVAINDNTVELGDIKFTEPGTYDYVITPDLKGDKENQYDLPEEIVVRYKVTADEEAGTLKVEQVLVVDGVEQSSASGEAYEVEVSRKDAAPTTESVSLNLDLGEPQYDGAPAISGVKLVPTGENVGNAPLPTNDIATKNADGSYNFDGLTFTDIDQTYEYFVEPVLPEGREDQYEVPVVKMVITTSRDDETNEVKIEKKIYVQDENGEFVEVDDESEISAIVSRKDPEATTEDVDLGLDFGTVFGEGEENQPAIVITANDPNSPMPAGASEDESGNVSFKLEKDENGNYVVSEWAFGEEGEYVYTLTPELPSGREELYDQPKIELVIDAKRDEETNKIVITPTILVNGEEVENMEDLADAINSQITLKDPEAIVDQPKVEGLDLSDIFGNETPYIKIDGVDGAPMPSDNQDGSKVYAADKNGAFDLGGIVFDEEGEYTYIIKPSTADGDTNAFSGTDIEMIAKVERNEETNELEVSYTFRVDGIEYDSLEDAKEAIEFKKVTPPYTIDNIASVAALGAGSVVALVGVAAVSRKRK